MHLPMAGDDFRELVPLLTLFFLLLAVLAAWKIFRRTFGDPVRDELERLNDLYARGLLAFDQYQREKAKLHQKYGKPREATDGRHSEASQTSHPQEPTPSIDPPLETTARGPDVTDSGGDPPAG